MSTGSAVAIMPTWESTVQQGTTGVGYIGMVASGDTVNLIWSGFDTSAVVRHRRSSNEGASYASEQTLNANGSLELEEQIMVSGTTGICLSIYPDQSWNDGYARTGGEIKARRSTDGGATWSTAVALTSGSKAHRYALAASGTTWNLFYMDYKLGYWNIYHTRSTDDGVTWGTHVLLVSGEAVGSTLGGPGRPEVAIDGNTLHLVWLDPRDERGSCVFDNDATMPKCTEIYYRRSMDLGATWDVEQRLTTSGSGNYSGRPSIAAKDGAVLICFDYHASGAQNEIMLIRSLSGGKAGTWSSPRYLTSGSTAINTHGKIKFGVGRDVIIVWNAVRGGLKHVYGRRSNTAGLTWGPEQQVSAAEADIPMLVATSGYWHVAYASKTLSNISTRRGAR